MNKGLYLTAHRDNDQKTYFPIKLCFHPYLKQWLNVRLTIFILGIIKS